MALFEKGRELILADGGWKPSGSSGAKYKAVAVDMGLAGPATGAWGVTGATFASTVVTLTLPSGHGFLAGHAIEVFLVGGLTNVNGVWTVTSVTATTVVFSVTTTPTGTYTSGGYVVNLSLAQFVEGATSTGLFITANVAAGAVSRSGALSSLTNTNGVADADDAVFTNVSGNTIEAIAIVQFATTFAGSDVADTAAKLVHLITPSTSGTVGLPVTPNTANINITWSASGIFKI